MESLIQCLAAFIGCFGFTFIFRIQKNIRFSNHWFSDRNTRMVCLSNHRFIK